MRGLDEDFLHPKYEKTLDPLLLPDMEKAVERIRSAVDRGEKVLIYGDYDADGVTASVVMEEALKLSGVKEIEIMLPDRFADGYGMSKKIIKKAKDMGAGLVVTVDCGSGNREIIEELKEMGVETIVTDHHECTRELPDAVAVVNPKREDSAAPETARDLAGVGVAFKVAQGLVGAGMIPDGQEKWLLDLVLIGTICDSMPLVGENRILGYYGMVVFDKTKRAGLRELKKALKIKKINSDTIGFQIGPRINAAGRIESAGVALDLIRASSGAEAAKLVQKLEELNLERKKEQRLAVEEIRQRGISENPVIIEVGKWHEGVLGIVAGALTEEYKKPAFALTEVAGDILKGSGRSFGEFNLASALVGAKDIIISGGGHREACGVKIEKNKLADFNEVINDYYNSLNLKNQERFLEEKPDLEAEIGDLTLELVDELKQLEPFSVGNKEPIFEIKNAEIIEARRMGAEGKHLSLMIKGGNEKAFKTVAFYAPEEWLRVESGEKRDILIKICKNEWNGIESIEGRIVKIFGL